MTTNKRIIRIWRRIDELDEWLYKIKQMQEAYNDKLITSYADGLKKGRRLYEA